MAIKEKKKKKEEILRITPEMNILDLVELFPETREVFAEKGLPCLGCVASRFEKIADIAKEFGMKSDDLVKEMEKVVNNKNKKINR